MNLRDRGRIIQLAKTNFASMRHESMRERLRSARTHDCCVSKISLSPSADMIAPAARSSHAFDARYRARGAGDDSARATTEYQIVSMAKIMIGSATRANDGTSLGNNEAKTLA